MISTPVCPILWQDDHVRLIDQTRLPREYVIVEVKRYEDMVEAIKTMVVRGAPAIGVAAAYGVYLGARVIQAEDRQGFLEQLEAIADKLRTARPTAVNLFWAIDRMVQTAHQTIGPLAHLKQALLETAQAIAQEDLQTCRAIGTHGLNALPPEPYQLRILTYCNTGSLATAGYGTALGVIRSAQTAGRLAQVYACETRPRLQGARLTAWECVQEDMPVTLITDNMAAHCMQQGLVDVVIVGADRIAANGDTANKIGTYSLALVARAHGLPFFVAAPRSTIDFSLTAGEQIPIEERQPGEIYQIGDMVICPEGVGFYNPSFDVTPAALVTAIITEQGVVAPGNLEPIATSGSVL